MKFNPGQRVYVGYIDNPEKGFEHHRCNVATILSGPYEHENFRSPFYLLTNSKNEEFAAWEKIIFPVDDGSTLTVKTCEVEDALSC